MKKERLQINWIGSWWGVFFASVLALALGVAFGAAELVFQKVQLVEASRKDKDPRRHEYVLGGDFGGENWREKARVLLSKTPTDIALTEGDFNLFLKNTLAERGGKVRIVANVKLRKETIQLGLLVYPNAKKDPMIFQSQGVLKVDKVGCYFVPQKTYVGALPLPAFVSGPFINATLRRQFSGRHTEGLANAWASAKSVSIVGGAVRLSWL